jgi:hypothetical protein
MRTPGVRVLTRSTRLISRWDEPCVNFKTLQGPNLRSTDQSGHGWGTNLRNLLGLPSESVFLGHVCSSSALTLSVSTWGTSLTPGRCVEVQLELRAAVASPAGMPRELGFTVRWFASFRSVDQCLPEQRRNRRLWTGFHHDGDGLVLVTLMAAIITVTIRRPRCHLGQKDADRAGHAGAMVGAVAVRDLVEVLLVVVLGGLLNTVQLSARLFDASSWPADPSSHWFSSFMACSRCHVPSMCPGEGCPLAAQRHRFQRSGAAGCSHGSSWAFGGSGGPVRPVWLRRSRLTHIKRAMMLAQP